MSGRAGSLRRHQGSREDRCRGPSPAGSRGHCPHSGWPGEGIIVEGRDSGREAHEEAPKRGEAGRPFLEAHIAEDKLSSFPSHPLQKTQSRTHDGLSDALQMTPLALSFLFWTCSEVGVGSRQEQRCAACMAGRACRGVTSSFMGTVTGHTQGKVATTQRCRLLSHYEAPGVVDALPKSVCTSLLQGTLPDDHLPHSRYLLTPAVLLLLVNPS